MVLLVPGVFSLEFGEDRQLVENDREYELSFPEPGLEGNVTVTYFDNGEEIGESEEPSYTVEFDSEVEEDQFQEFELEAVAENDTDEATETIDLEVDRINPEIDEDSVNHELLEDGRVNFTWSSSDQGSGVATYRLERDSEEQSDPSEFVKDIEPGNNVQNTLTDENNQYFYNTSFEYVLQVTDQAGNTDEYIYPEEISPLDEQPPEILSVTPESESTINNEEVTTDLEVTAEDRLSGLETINITIDREYKTEQNISSEMTSLTMDISDLDDQTTWEPEIFVEDQVGNTETYTTNFTTDRQPPEIEFQKYPDDNLIMEETEIGVEVDSEQQDSIEEIECLLRDEDYGNDFTPNDNDIYTCEEHVDPSSIHDGEALFEIIFTDTPGNEEKVEIGTFHISSEPPRIEDLDIEPESSSEPPEISLEAIGEGAEIQEMEYFFDENAEEGEIREIDDIEGNEIDYVFEPELHGIEDGTHNVYLRVKDEAGRWSETEQEEFSIYWDEEPQPVLRAEDIETEPQTSKEVELEAGNQGKVPIEDAYIEFNDTLEGESEEFDLDLDEFEQINLETENNETAGTYNETVYLNAGGVTTSDSIEVVVTASEEEAENLTQELENFTQTKEDLKQGLEDLKEREASGQELQQFNETLESFDNSIEALKQAEENEEYYLIADKQQELQQKERQALNQLDEAETAHITGTIIHWTTRILPIVILITIIGLYRFYGEQIEERFNIKLPKITGPHLPHGITHNYYIYRGIVELKIFKLHLKRRIKRSTGKEEKWEGFT